MADPHNDVRNGALGRRILNVGDRGGDVGSWLVASERVSCRRLADELSREMLGTKRSGVYAWASCCLVEP